MNSCYNNLTKHILKCNFSMSTYTSLFGFYCHLPFIAVYCLLCAIIAVYFQIIVRHGVCVFLIKSCEKCNNSSCISLMYCPAKCIEIGDNKIYPTLKSQPLILNNDKV